MSLTNAIGSAVAGINAAEQKVEKSAENIAEVSVSAEPDLMPQDIVSIKSAKAAHTANVNMMKIAAEMEREVINIIA